MVNTTDILRNLIAFDTTSRNSSRAIIDYIAAYLNKYGIKSEIVEGKEAGKASLFTTIGESNKPGIVLAGHIDTVPVDGQEWSSDPFTLTQRGDKLYGRGTCDMKGFIACVLATVPELAKAKLAQPVHLAFTHDEETSMDGAAETATFMRDKNIKPAWVWIGEPTLHKIIDSHKGCATFETKLTGVPTHAGKPALGLSAIEMGHDFISILRAVGNEKRATAFVPSRFDPPYSTINLGTVTGGTAQNIVAEHCEVVWETRAHPGDNHDAMLADIEKRAAEKLAPALTKFKNSHPQVGCKTCAQFNIPPLLPTSDNPGHKILAQFTGNKETEAVSFCTEAGFFQKLGTAVVVCGPGSIDQAHKADEFVAIAELAKCVDLIRSVLLPSVD